MLCMQPMHHDKQAMEVSVCYFPFQVAFQKRAFTTSSLSTVTAAPGWASLECLTAEQAVSSHLHGHKTVFGIICATAVNIFLVCCDLPGNPTTLAALVMQCALFRLLQLALHKDYAINLITHKHIKSTVATIQSHLRSVISVYRLVQPRDQVSPVPSFLQMQNRTQIGSGAL